MRKQLLLLGMTLVFSALAACARIPKHLPQNPAFSPQSLVFSQREMSSAGSWPQADWWKAAKSRQLDELVAAALQQNPELHAAGARVLYAEAQVTRAHSRLLPHFAAGFQLTQQYFSVQGLHLQANGTSNTFAEFNPLLLQYHVDLWGRDRDLVRAARGDLAMSQAEEADARLLVSSAVAVHYFALRGDESLLRAELRLRAWQKRALSVAQAGFTSGLQSATPLHEASTSLAQSAERIAQLQAAVAAERHAIAALCGQGPGVQISAAPSSAQASLPLAGVPRNLPLNLLGHRPDIVAARWAVEAAAARVGAAKAAFYPNINLHLLAGWNSIHLADLFDPANFAHALGPAITLPIFEGGALRAALRAQNAVYLAAQDQYQNRILQALRQVADLLSTRRALLRQESALAHAERAQRAQWHVQETAWQSGLQDGGTRIPVRIRLIQLEEQEITLQTAAWQNWALLESALGGGYSATTKVHPHD